MKKNVIWIIASLLMITRVAAQPEDMEPKEREKIESLKRAFYSQKLNLTVAESEKFWPVYNEFEKSKKDIRKQMKAEKDKTGAGTTEAQLRTTVGKMSQLKREEIQLEEKFMLDCIPILGVEKTILLHGLDEEFKKEVVQAMRDRRREQGGPPPGGRPRQGGPKPY